MTKKFNSYKELIEEKQKLEVLLHAQKELLRYDVKALKAEFLPVKDAIETIKKFTTKDKSNMLLTAGSDLLINAVIKNLLLARTGWVTKFIVPYFMKNFSSHVLADNKEKWFHKLKSWMGFKNGKQKKDETTKKNEEDVF